MTAIKRHSDRILVTGGAGFIGSVTAHILLSQGFQVTVLDDCSTGHADAVPVNAKVVRGTLLDKMAIRKALENCSSVIHFAGKSLVNESVTHPNLYRQINVEGSRNLLEEMRTAGIGRIVFSSSASTYGQPETVPISENALTRPTSPYGETKLAVEQLLSEESKTYRLASASLRYFNVAGALRVEDRWLGERHDPETHLIPNILISSTAEPVKIFGNTWPTFDGTCIRDYVHVIDVADAHILALTALRPSTHIIFNLGGGRGYSVREVLQTASKVLGRAIPQIETSVREGDPAVLIADITKAQTQLGWQPTRDLEAMIHDCANSMRLL
jgi:UDP-glucose 4-epimerase